MTRTQLAALELGDDVELRVLSAARGSLLILQLQDERTTTDTVLDRDEATQLRDIVDRFLGGAR